MGLKLLLLCVLLCQLGSAEQICISSGRSGNNAVCEEHVDYLSAEDLETLHHMRTSKIVDVENCTGLHVRPTTKLITLEAGFKMKCKNEKKVKYGMEVLGNEVHAFYFDRMMRIGSVPPASVIDYSGRRWKSVRRHELLYKNWFRGDVLSCTRWYDDAVDAILPEVFKNATQEHSVPHGEQVGWTDETKRVVEVWSDMLAFDFLAGVNDRFPPAVSSGKSFRLKKDRPPGTTTYNHCNRDGCEVNNLYVRPSGKMIFVDNTAAFFYDKNGSMDHIEWVLKDTCVFSKQFYDQVTSIGSEYKGPIRLLTAIETKHDPNMQIMPWNRQNLFGDRFDQLNVYFQECQEQHGTKLWFFE